MIYNSKTSISKSCSGRQSGSMRQGREPKSTNKRNQAWWNISWITETLSSRWKSNIKKRRKGSTWRSNWWKIRIHRPRKTTRLSEGKMKTPYIWGISKTISASTKLKKSSQSKARSCIPLSTTSFSSKSLTLFSSKLRFLECALWKIQRGGDQDKRTPSKWTSMHQTWFKTSSSISCHPSHPGRTWRERRTFTLRGGLWLSISKNSLYNTEDRTRTPPSSKFFPPSAWAILDWMQSAVRVVDLTPRPQEEASPCSREEWRALFWPAGNQRYPIKLSIIKSILLN